MTTRPRIGVVGAGAWGTALATVATQAGNHVVLWTRETDVVAEMATHGTNARYLPGVKLDKNIHPTSDLADLDNVEAILIVTPAQTIRAVVRMLAENLKKSVPLVLCAKGIERESGQFMHEVARGEWPEAPLAVLSGPSFADDVVRGLPTAVTLASEDEALAQKLALQLSSGSFRIYHSEDVRSVEIGGAAKNVFAIACGAVMGRGLGESAKAALMARSFAELMRFASAYGGRPQTLMGLSGFGDMVLTCSTAHSRNFAFGERLGKGASLEEASGGKLTEGVFTASVLVQMAQEKNIDMPIAQTIDAVLQSRLTLDEAVDVLMNRPLKREV
ncbi:NAD(P)H-dependent glycerol-3-phosphate dehydrogenase [Microvirga sp. W0021]|uniref:Glycerol-3-phosphate dehydrogenase [NAD(P)+] n=1 Tax=Hohaiivirga grylli TaxID=3133970 RepID=A0ABV0BEX9_9HYPH